MTTSPASPGREAFDFRRYEQAGGNGARPGGGGGGGGGGGFSRKDAPRAPLGKLFDREPPCSIEAEMSLLGSMILDPRCIGDTISVIKGPEFFYDERHGLIFSALVETFDKHHTGDLVQLNQLLADKGSLQLIGGTEYLVRLASDVPTAANAPHFARIVAEKFKLRRLIDAAGQILFDTYHAGQTTADDASKIVDAAESKIFEIAQEEMSSDPQALAQLLQIEYDRLLAIEDGKAVPSGVRCGYFDLDRLLSGFQPGEMIIIAARPSMGKCLAATEEITLNDGRVATIEEIVRSRCGRIPTLTDALKLSTAAPSNFVDDGRKPVFEVVTRLGRRVRTTLSHPFLTVSGWRRLEELREGDCVAVPRALPIFGTGTMRECEVKLLAYLIGDGGLTGSAARFTNSNPRIAAEFESCVQEFGGMQVVRSDHRPHTAPSWRASRLPAATRAARAEFGGRLAAILGSRPRRAVASQVGVSAASITHWCQGKTMPDLETFDRLCQVLRVEPADLSPAGHAAARRMDPSPLTQWLTGLGLMGAGSHAKFVPAPVFSLTRPLLALFLNRLFATDGWATRLASGQCQLGYASVSERLARQVQHLLLRFGIIAKLRHRFVRYRDARRSSWQLDITATESITTFAREIGIFGKEDALGRVTAELARRGPQTNVDLIPAEVWDEIEIAKGGMSWAELGRAVGAPGGLHPRRRAPTRARLGAIARVLGNQRLNDLASSDVFWDPIVSITPLGEQQVYDLTVPETHNFVAADVCVHNTAFVLNVAEQIAMGTSGPDMHTDREPQAVGVFSLEMSKGSLVQRLISSAANIDSHRLRSGALSHGEWDRVFHACQHLSRAPIYVDDTPGLTLLQLRARARRMVHQHGVKLLMIDYLQLLSSPQQARESRQVEVSAISRGVKALARELKIPVIALSQLNRGPEGREGNRPRLSDLRESGSLEQDADVVMLIHREAYYHLGDHEWLAENPDKENLAEIIIAKQRNGPTDTAELTWDPHITRFKNHADTHAPPPPPKPQPRQAAAPQVHTRPIAQPPVPVAPPPASAASAGAPPVDAPFDAPPSPPAAGSRGVGFGAGPRTGPVANFRDGGGPDDDEDDLPPPPLPTEEGPAPF